jgi:hypothetical protein
MLTRFAFLVVLTVICVVVKSSILHVAAYVTGPLAVVFGALYLWQGRFATKVTGRGIEAHGYFNHFVPWQEVRDIEVRSRSARLAVIPDATTLLYPGGIDSQTMPAAHDGLGSAGTVAANRGARIASIKLVRADGSKLLLRAPLVSVSAPDPDFDYKAQQLDEICMRSGRGAIS